MNSTDKVIKLVLEYNDNETIYLPLEENLDEETLDTFEELKEKWEKVKWGYHGTVTVELINLVPAPELPGLFEKTIGGITPEQQTALDWLDKVNFQETGKCTEFDIWCFKSKMVDPEFYNTPWDKNPDGRLYSSYFAVDCDKGSVYSKDFAYFDCEECNRTICEQNPSNGWHTQYRFIGDSYRICLKCFEEQQFSEGSDVDEIIRTKQIPGMFFNTNELEENGFVLLPEIDHFEVGMGRVGSTDPNNFFNKLQKLKDEKRFENKIVVINYESMAIGGLGGYVSVYLKDKPNENNSESTINS